MSKLQTLIKKCKCGVFVTVNEHRDYYQSAENAIKDINERESEHGAAADFIGKDLAEKMIETDTIIDIQFYPNTPIGFNKVYHYDLDKALDEALSTFEDDTQ